MHDAKGNELKVGDYVLIPARVKELTPGEDYCNVTLESLLGRRPDGQHETISAINTGVLVRANYEDDNVPLWRVDAHQVATPDFVVHDLKEVD